MPKSTLLNQIRTLEEAGYLLRIRDGQAYRLGYKVMQLSYCAQAGSPVAQYAIPVMEDLQSATGDIIYLTSCLLYTSDLFHGTDLLQAFFTMWTAKPPTSSSR